MGKRRLVRVFVLVLLCVGIAIGPIGSSVYAAETHWGRAKNVGYFSGNNYAYGYDPGGWPNHGYVLPPVNGVAIPSSVTTNITVDKLIDFLKNTYKGDQSNGQAAMVSFIVHTMMGVDGANAARTVTAAEWTDLNNRMNASGITINVEHHSTSRNTFHQTTSVMKNNKIDRTQDALDVGWATSGQSGSAVVIKNKGTAVYALFVSCANPDGNLNGGIPASSHYYLTPTVDKVNPTSVAEPGTTVTVTPNVNNSGTKTSDAAPWQVSRLYLPSGQSAPVASSDSTKSPAAYYGNGLVSLGGDSGGIFAVGDINPGTQTDTVGDQIVGTQVCYAVSVQNYSDNPATTNWRHSAPTCIKIGTRPKTQVWGGDLINSGLVNTSVTNKNINGVTHTFGSWIEYGIFAVKTITGAASGSAYAGSGLAGASNCNENNLSFANSIASGSCLSTTVIGNYTNSPSIPNVGASFPATGAPVFSGGNLTAQALGTYTGSGTINISGGNIVVGKWFVLNAPGATVNISGDIKYSNGVMHNIGDIPQVIIIAGNINIAGGVNQVDSWLIASSGLNTCSDVAPGVALDSKTCKQALVVNGPVMAGQLYLRRTAGSGTGQDHSGDPAEIFNLRPDAYMWASLRATGGGNRIQTVYTTELPPRL